MASWTVSAALVGLSGGEAETVFFALLDRLPAPWGVVLNGDTGDLNIMGELDVADEASAVTGGRDVALKTLPESLHGCALVVTAQPTADLLPG